MQTRLQAKRSAQNQVSDVVSINWCFFNPQRPSFDPVLIKIPERLFSGATMYCRGLFSNKLQRWSQISLKEQSITFWRPKHDLPVETAKKEWEKFTDHEYLKNSLEKIDLMESFSEKLNLDNGFLHLIVTVEEGREELDTGTLYHSRKQYFSSPDGDKNVNPLYYARKQFFAPSDGIKPSVFFKKQVDESNPQVYYCSRPASMEDRLPLALLDPVYGQFVDDCKNVAYTSKDMDFALHLKVEMSRFFEDEYLRRNRLSRVLKEYGIDIPRDPEKPYKTSGCVLHNDRLILISEVKNEMCGNGSEPNIQALLYYREVLGARLLWEDVSSCHPCFTIVVVGPLIVFSGCALTNHVTSECFSCLPLAFHTDDDDAFEKLARHLAALKRAMVCLTERYNKKPDAASLPSHAVSDIFPYKRSFGSLVLDGAPSTTFSYKEERNDGGILFNGEMEGGIPIFIKFVRKYGRQAHQFCAANGFAPKLYGLEELPGGWLMIIMECLNEQWIRLRNLEEDNPLSKEQKAELKENIRDCLRLLHSQDMVHGDVRDVNIMVNKGDPSQFKLVDFDWADKVGEARYPMFVNLDPELGRPEDVKAFEKITIEHDIHMLKSL